MGFFYKTKGVISVFLIIIMLPLLTSAVLLVDGTRYHSAKTIVQEAGDLAAYSTIADYNIDLKDEYGLFAIKDKNVSDTFKNYFKESLGCSDTDAQSYSDMVQSFISSSVFKGGNYKDAKFFNLYNFNVVNAKADGMYPLSEPGVLQNQIVEYSKYRGIETLLERFEILTKFDKISDETKEGQETIAAVENLSNIEENYVSIVSTKVTEIKSMVENYDAMISSLLDLVKTYEDCAATEMAAMAIKSSNIYSKKQARIDAYNAVKAKLDDIINMANDINSKAESASSNAQRAKEKLEGFINNHKDQQEAVRTANQDLEMLNEVLSQNSTTYSLWNLRQNISNTQANSLKSSLKAKMDKLNVQIQKSYTQYQSDRNAAEDKDTVRYHLYDLNGNELGITLNDHTEDGTTISDAETTTGPFVEKIVGEIFRENRRIGTVNLSSYQVGFDNIFLDKANGGKAGAKVTADKAAGDANSAKKDNNELDLDYQTIPGNKASLLPSKCADEQSEVNIPDVSSNSASSTLSAANDTSGNILSKFLESSRNDILTSCYLLDNFKTRVTARNINSSTEHSGISDRNLVDWRYSSENGELDMRYRPKKDLDTFFATNEVEYVFGGCKSEFNNAAIVYSWIYGTRFINNFVAVYSAYSSGDDWIRVDIDAAAAAASAATFGAVPFTVFKWIFITAWAAGETALDLALLIDDGFKVPLIKTSKTLFIRDILDIGNAFSYEGRLNYLRSRKDDQNLSNKINVSYEDYLIILLAFVGRETRLKRIADLIQLNMQKRYGEDFAMSSQYTYIKADTTVKIKYLFQPVQQFKGSYIGSGLKLENTIYQGY